MQNLVPGRSYFLMILSMLFFFVLCNQGVFAQNPPETEIFLVDLTFKGQTVTAGKPVNITLHKGYDNQPSFTPDGSGILYTSNRGEGQTDIFRYDIKKKTTTQLTRTPESEYSPTITPDGAFFSVIRVEKDNTQRLWKFPVSGSGEPVLVLEKVKPIGYHCWLSVDQLALFILGKPNSLQLAQVGSEDTTWIEGNIGRSIHKVPGKKAVSFVHKRGAGEWVIKQLDLGNNEISEISATLEGSEDFVWTANGNILMCREAGLYILKTGEKASWSKVSDFGSFGIKQLTRLAFDPKSNKLALVAQQ